MRESTLLHAKRNIDAVGEDYGVKTWISLDGQLYVELSSGKSYELSENEIKYQAIEYLKSEISYIENNF
jgi:hypothetical protein